MWDEEESSFNDAPAMTSSGNGALSKLLGGTVRGIGRGSKESGQSNGFPNGKNTSEDRPGPKMNGSGGFGGNSRGGFGSRTNDESSSGFGGNSRGGFGSRTNDESSSGFGGNSRGGFGSRTNEDSSSGFGGGSRGGFGSRTNDESSSGFGGNSRGGFGSRTNDESSSGFGGNSRGGFGSRTNEDSSSGFGGGNRGGFGSRTNEDSSSGFGGGSRGGFGSRTNDESSSGFGGNSRGGFGSRTNDESSSGFGGGSRGNSGGFGGGSRGGFGSRASNDNSDSGFHGRSNGNSGFGSSRGHVNGNGVDDSEESENFRFGGSTGGRGRPRGGRGGGHGGREGDWTCPNSECGNVNFAFRNCCQRCDTAKPGDSDNTSNKENLGSRSGGFRGKGGFGTNNDLPGGSSDRQRNEWVCPNSDCGHKNFAFRSACQKCDAPKVSSGNSEDKPREAPYIPPTPSEREEDIFSGAVQKGIHFDRYDDIPVEVSGRNRCEVISSFDEAGLYPTFLRNVKRANFEKPTPIQKYSIPIIAAGRDLMACAQTGSGKTAAFLLPVLTAMIKNGLTTDKYQDIQTPQAICVAPTRELVLQIHNDCRKFAFQTDIKPVVVYGGTSLGHQMRQIENGAHFVTGTPGRLLDIINRGKISLEKVSFLILDEADRMLDMGFEPEIRRLVETLGMPAKTERQTLMFSATFPEEIQKLAADFLNDYLFVTVGRVGGANTDVSQNFFEVDRQQKRESLCDILNAGGGEKTLVFVEMKRNADFLASYLCQSGYPTTSIHGDRLQKEREEALDDFKSGKAHVLVATSVAARGLDIPEVKHVINYDLPASIDEYVHRIGRTGRCGNLGKATSFFSSDTDQLMAPHLVRILKEAKQPVPEWLEAHACGMAGDAGSFHGRFGGKDIRRGKFGGGGDRTSDNRTDNWASGIGAQCDTADGDDEAWD